MNFLTYLEVDTGRQALVEMPAMLGYSSVHRVHQLSHGSTSEKKPSHSKSVLIEEL